ncbi:MAG: sodium-dependent transporter [Candidatus Brocadiae bacterium]|nr:sodium-dependent transporter [Candidatus Brocadiia bacterium]
MEKKEYWKSEWSLVLAGLGMAIGCGNIWRFPRIAAQYGGSTFIVASIIALFIWSVPILVLEMVMGKSTRKGPIGAFSSFLGTRYAWMGGWITFVTLLIGCYYSVITGWCLKYIGLFAGGFPKDIAPGDVWNSFIASYEPVFFHFLALAIGIFLVIKGIQKGLELANKIVLPLLFLFMFCIAILAISRPGGIGGVEYLLFRFQFQDFQNPALWLEAFAQSAWSTGAGWGLWLTYGVYCPEKTPVVKNCFLIATGDLIASILAGLMVIPTIFSHVTNVQERMTILSSGNQGLAFQHLVNLFQQMEMGRLLGSVFFLALFLAAISSLIAMLELGVRSCMDTQLSRKKAALFVTLFIGLLGIPSAWSMSIFSNQDWVWGLGLLISGLFVALAGIIKGVQNIQSNHLPSIGKWWKYCIQYCIPISCFFVLAWWMVESTKWENAKWWDIAGLYTPLNVAFQWAGLLILLILFNRYLAKSSQKSENKNAP